MKKMLTLLTVAAMPALFGGCATCCPTGLCPCCPCNWFDRPAPCPPAYPAPVVAAPAACPPAVAPGVTPQYVTPLAAPYAAAPAPCATWNPCQGVVMAQPMMAQPQAAPCCPQPGLQALQQPMLHPAQPAYYAEPSCGYVEASCGAPFAGIVSYGPEMPVEYGPCDSGCCEAGAATPPVPDAYVDPQPMAE